MKSIHHWIYWIPLGLFTFPILCIITKDDVELYKELDKSAMNNGFVMGLEYSLIILLCYTFL